MLFSMWGGAVADRYSKRGILMVTQALMGGLALILGVLALTGTVQIWHVYVLAFALGMVTVVDNPTRQAFAVEMVGKDGMANAIALNSAVFNLARIARPGRRRPGDRGGSGPRPRSWSTPRPTARC